MIEKLDILIKIITIGYNLSGVSIVIGREKSLLFYFEVKMTVSTTTNKVVYIGNGGATSFAVPFPFLEKEHLKVRQLLNDIQTERTDWMISDGNMVFETAPAENAQIVIMREVPFTQETDYRENEILPAETLERNFDKLTMQVQQLKEQAERAITIDVFDDTDAASLIPSIKQAVSDAAVYAGTAQDKAKIATDKAENAAICAKTASDKAEEVAVSLSVKADKDLSNCTRPYITETFYDKDGWYRVWSDGWIEQGGNQYDNSTAYSVNRRITFIKPFKEKLCSLSVCFNGSANASAYNGGLTSPIPDLSGFQFTGSYNGTNQANAVSWYACGY